MGMQRVDVDGFPVDEQGRYLAKTWEESYATLLNVTGPGGCATDDFRISKFRGLVRCWLKLGVMHDKPFSPAQIKAFAEGLMDWPCDVIVEAFEVGTLEEWRPNPGKLLALVRWRDDLGDDTAFAEDWRRLVENIARHGGQCEPYQRVGERVEVNPLSDAEAQAYLERGERLPERGWRREWIRVVPEPLSPAMQQAVTLYGHGSYAEGCERVKAQLIRFWPEGWGYNTDPQVAERRAEETVRGFWSSYQKAARSEERRRLRASASGLSLPGVLRAHEDDGDAS